MHVVSVLSFVLFVLVLSLTLVSTNRVYELSDKFVEAYKKDTKSWLVKFYAPWCHHCKQMEPIYMQVAQKLHNEDIGVYVGRIDCTRFQNAATHFSVRGFPTLLFVNNERVVEFNGDRTKEDIIDFTRRLMGPKVRPVINCGDLPNLLELHKVYFVYFGQFMPGEMVEAIDDFYSSNWFYQSDTVCPGFTEGLYSLKGDKKEMIRARFENTSEIVLRDWIKQERFPQFVKVTPGNLNMLLKSGKILVVAVVEEYHSVGKLVNGKQEEFKETVETIANTYKNRDPFIFGWCSHPEMLSSIALQAIEPVPKLIAISSVDLKYHILNSENKPQDITQFLVDLVDQKVEMIGGNSFYHRSHRVVYDMLTSLANMYKGNPILTLLLIGLPMAFLSIIIYTSCCTDFLDAREEDEEELVEEESHEKRD